MRKTLGATLVLLAAGAGAAQAFCGFYVAAATGELYNDSSKVIIARDGKRTTLSMFNNYRGDPKEFALVVPVPPGIKKQDVKVIDAKLFAHLDQWSAPRLVEYWERDPCWRPPPMKRPCPNCGGGVPKPTAVMAPRKLQVTVEAEFSVGEYDIVVLSAKQSGDLEIWLRQNKYMIPAGAAEILKPYVAAKTQFFVAKVNLERLAETPGKSTADGIYLSPLSFGYTSDRVSLPIKLGMINGRGTQDLLIFMISRLGRFEVTNYANPKIPTDIDVPESMKDKGKFGPFFLKMFARSWPSTRARRCSPSTPGRAAGAIPARPTPSARRS